MSLGASLLALVVVGEPIAPAEAQAGGDVEFDSVWIVESLVEQGQQQVRIEQRATVRVAPRPQSVRPNVLNQLPRNPVPRRVERGSVKCVPTFGLAGVETVENRKLILYLRDRRQIVASLDRTCRARDFYSGFYLERNADGKLCADRDMLLSRNGASCRIIRLRNYVPAKN